MAVTVRLAVRDWDYLTPLALGDVKPEGFALELHRVGTLPDDLATDARYDGAEISMSRFVQARARGEGGIVGVPHVLMRGFRHRCIVTARTSRLTRIADLAGRRIGVTGWQDSGNTWTRAILRREGIGTDDAYWYAGRLTEAHPITDRLGKFARPGRIEPCPGERPMMDLLREGWLDAVFTPFMPPGFFRPDSAFRPFLPDYVDQELHYFRAVGYVPGHHLLGLKADFARAHPGIGRAISAVIDESARIWWAKREKYADTSPWFIDEAARVARELPADWDRNGFDAIAPMLDDFCEEMHVQKLTERRVLPRELFPDAA